MQTYPVILTPDGDTFLVTSPDFPELKTFGETKADALNYAVGAFEEAIAARISRGEQIPRPSKPEPGEVMVALDNDRLVQGPIR